MAIDPLVGFRDDDNRSGKSRGTGAARVYGALREEILCLRLAPASPLDEVGLSARFDFIIAHFNFSDADTSLKR